MKSSLYQQFYQRLERVFDGAARVFRWRRVFRHFTFPSLHLSLLRHQKYPLTWRCPRNVHVDGRGQIGLDTGRGAPAHTQRYKPARTTLADLLARHPAATRDLVGVSLRRTHQIGGSVLVVNDGCWMTRQDLAERLGLSTATLADWAHKGTGPRYARFGKHVRYRLTDVINWEETCFASARSPE